MENKEVINYINGLLRKELCALPTHFDKEADGEVYDSIEDAEKIIEVSKLVTAALEKQISKKPIIITDICEELPFVLLCPICNAELEAYEHHCTCGQTLDWSDAE